MQANKNITNGPLLPKCLTFQQAVHYTGLSAGTLRNYEKAKLIRVSNILTPGAGRGRKLIDRQSLDELIEGSVGVETTADICKVKERSAQ